MTGVQTCALPIYVIMGHIIPAGTGFDYHRNIKLKHLVDLPEEPEQEESSAAESGNPLLG